MPLSSIRCEVSIIPKLLIVQNETTDEREAALHLLVAAASVGHCAQRETGLSTTAHRLPFTINWQQWLVLEMTDESVDFSMTEIVTEISKQLIPPLSTQEVHEAGHSTMPALNTPC